MMKDILSGMGGFGETVNRVFMDMEVAEEEIRRGQGQYPGRAEAINKAFGILRRPLAIRADALYRSHVRELIERVGNEQDCRPSTKAEILCHLSNASFEVRLNKQGILIMAYLMDVLLYEIEGIRDMVEGLRGSVGVEESVGETVEEIRRLQHKYMVEDRVIR